MEAAKPIGALMRESLDNANNNFLQLKQLAIRAMLPDRQGLSAETSARQTEHNTKASAVRSGCDQALENLQLVAEKAGENDSVGELMGYAENARYERANLAEELVRAAVQRVEIAGEVLAELRAIPPRLEAELEKLVSKVKGELEKIGCGLEAQVGFSHGNAKAAERQLDHLARHGNLRSKAALAALRDAKAEVDGAQTTLGASHQMLSEARALLVKVAMQSIAG